MNAIANTVLNRHDNSAATAGPILAIDLGKYKCVECLDLRQVLAPQAESDPGQCRAACGRATRYLRLLRAHGLIRKVPRTHCYRVTSRGTQVMATALKLRATDLTALAA